MDVQIAPQHRRLVKARDVVVIERRLIGGGARLLLAAAARCRRRGRGGRGGRGADAEAVGAPLCGEGVAGLEEALQEGLYAVAHHGLPLAVEDEDRRDGQSHKMVPCAEDLRVFEVEGVVGGLGGWAVRLIKRVSCGRALEERGASVSVGARRKEAYHQAHLHHPSPTLATPRTPPRHRSAITLPSSPLPPHCTPWHNTEHRTPRNKAPSFDHTRVTPLNAPPPRRTGTGSRTTACAPGPPRIAPRCRPGSRTRPPARACRRRC